MLLQYLLVLTAAISVISTPSSAGQVVDVALVLAVDCSGSVDRAEFALQRKGIAAALRDPAIIAAATSGPNRRIGVNIMLWGDPDEHKFDTGWLIVSSPESGERAAKVAEDFNYLIGGGTGIGNAVAFGVRLLNNGEVQSTRQVIDVSGDGIESWELREPRFKLVDAQVLRAKAGVTVNGLAIETDNKNLANYYRAKVAAGPESFVIAIATYQDFAEAIRRKILQELTPNMAQMQPNPLLRRASY